MLKPLSKVIIVVAMLLTFIGQAFAYTTMSCDMASDSHEMPMAHAMMNDTAMMDSSENEHSLMMKSQMSECCDVDCSCPANACASILIVSTESITSNVISSLDKISYNNFSLPQSHNKSLYRPPILS